MTCKCIDVTVLFKIVGLGLHSFRVHSTEVAAVTLPGFSVAYPASFGVAVSNQRAGSAVVLNSESWEVGKID